MLRDKKKELTHFSSEMKLTDEEAIESINKKLNKNDIKLDNPLESWQYAEKEWQNIESLITEFDCHGILNKEKATMILQYHDSLRYLVDEFYRADHTYHYSSKFHLSKYSSVKSFYWIREREFINKLFEHQDLLPLLAEVFRQGPYEAEMMLNPQMLNEVIKVLKKIERRDYGVSR